MFEKFFCCTRFEFGPFAFIENETGVTKKNVFILFNRQQIIIYFVNFYLKKINLKIIKNINLEKKYFIHQFYDFYKFKFNGFSCTI